ncbi:MAG: formate--tetrahydrofolate ligase [Candidatus Azotimanducaceae bacterium]|jgi:formate--tetrahydrofolate ligase
MQNNSNKALEPNRARTPKSPLPLGTPDIDIARSVAPQSILLLAQQRLGLPAEALIPYGHFKAKLDLSSIDTSPEAGYGKLVLVTAITPTPAGEGKTTTSVGLNDALNLLGKNSTVCLREPSLGPCFGMKGGAAGGGWAQVIPMEDINLHFNGDFHAITSAHNLLSAMIDNHLHWGNAENIDPRKITWRRVLDVNDRSLRQVVQGLGGSAHGIPRESGFDITVASEVMAIVCLAEDLDDLQTRLARIIIGRRKDKSVVTAGDIGADGAMTVLLKDALLPNLVQSLEHNPAFIHGGPFANIAHGCNSVSATRAALSLSDIVVTEAGFGADLGAEKFIDIKCRQSGLRPDAVVLVCTVRALKMQGGVKKADVAKEDLEALQKGSTNLRQHVRNLRLFGLNPIVCINRFPTDTPAELAATLDLCEQLELKAAVAEHWSSGGEGAIEVASILIEQLAQPSPKVQMLYEDDTSLLSKIETVATRIYGADGVDLFPSVRRQLEEFEQLGFGHLPVCIAKTQYSFTADSKQVGDIPNHTLPVREVRLAAGAGFVVVVCGEVMTMPGLPRYPAALDIRLDEKGLIEGLF